MQVADISRMAHSYTSAFVEIRARAAKLPYSRGC